MEQQPMEQQPMEPHSNDRQAQAWNGYEGEHWSRHQDRWDAVNEGFNGPVLDAAAIEPRDRVLDVGCGTGALTREAARLAVEGEVLGLDLSAPMLTGARGATERAGLTNLRFEQGDAQTHPLEPGSFDTVISRFGVMFFADPQAAFTNLAGALRPGGRLAFVCSADPGGNDWLTVMDSLYPYLPADLPGLEQGPMFSLADPDRLRALLTAAGFTRIDLALTESPGRWGSDPEDAAAFLLSTGPGQHLGTLMPPDAPAHATLVAALAPYQESGAVRLRTAAWLVTAVAAGD